MRSFFASRRFPWNRRLTCRRPSGEGVTTRLDNQLPDARRLLSHPRRLPRLGCHGAKNHAFWRRKVGKFLDFRLFGRAMWLPLRTKALVRGGGPGGARTRDQAIMSNLPTVRLVLDSALTWRFVQPLVCLVRSSDIQWPCLCWKECWIGNRPESSAHCAVLAVRGIPSPVFIAVVRAWSAPSAVVRRGRPQWPGGRIGTCRQRLGGTGRP